MLERLCERAAGEAVAPACNIDQVKVTLASTVRAAEHKPGLQNARPRLFTHFLVSRPAVSMRSPALRTACTDVEYG